MAFLALRLMRNDGLIQGCLPGSDHLPSSRQVGGHDARDAYKGCASWTHPFPSHGYIVVYIGK